MKPRSPYLSFAAVCLAFPVIIASCGDDATPETLAASGDEYEAELFPETKLLDESTLDAMAPDDGSGLLRFTATSTLLESLGPASVIIAGPSEKAPLGLLRIVRSVTRTAEGVTLETAQAPLQLAFRKLHVKVTRQGAPISGREAGSSPQSTPRAMALAATQEIDEAVFDADDNAATEADQVRIKGSIGGSADYVLGIDFEWDDALFMPLNAVSCVFEAIFGDGCEVEDVLPELRVGFEVSTSLGANFELYGAAYLGFNKEIEILHEMLEPVTIGIFVFFPSVDIRAIVSGQASSRFHTGINASASLGAGISWSSETGGSATPPGGTHTFETTADEVTLTANANATLKTALEVRLYDFAGPSAGFSVFADLSADRDREPCWDLAAGLNFDYGFIIGADLGPFGRLELGRWEDSFELLSESVASGECALPPDNAPETPGAGPTTEAFTSPQFTPWAHAYAGVLDSVPYNSIDGLYPISFMRGIDGHFTLSSRGARGLLKIDDEGTVIWSKKYRDAAAQPGDEPLHVQKTVSLGDATMLGVTYPPGIMKVTQSGAVQWAKGLPLPPTTLSGPNGDSLTQQSFIAAAPDGAGGAWLAGSFVPTAATRAAGLLVRVSSDGEILSSWSFADADRSLYPTVIVPLPDGGAVVSGFGWVWGGSPLFEGFVIRLQQDGIVRWAHKLRGYGDRINPAAGIVHSSGDVVIAGSLGTYSSGFALRLSQTGEIVSGAGGRPMLDLEKLAINGIAELPTTGFVVTGRYVDSYSPPSIFVGNLDSAGQMIWARQYRQMKPATDVTAMQTFPSLWLDDDGGVVVAALSSIPHELDGSYWVLKVPAKDGLITFTDGSEAKSEVVGGLTAEMTATAWPLTLASAALQLVPKTVLAEDVTMTVTTQAP